MEITRLLNHVYVPIIPYNREIINGQVAFSSFSLLGNVSKAGPRGGPAFGVGNMGLRVGSAYRDGHGVGPSETASETVMVTVSVYSEPVSMVTVTVRVVVPALRAFTVTEPPLLSTDSTVVSPTDQQ